MVGHSDRDTSSSASSSNPRRRRGSRREAIDATHAGDTPPHVPGSPATHAGRNDGEHSRVSPPQEWQNRLQLHNAPPAQSRAVNEPPSGQEPSRRVRQVQRRLDFGRISAAGALTAAQALLRNPPGPGATPDAQENWRQEIDQFLAIAQEQPGESMLPSGSRAAATARRQPAATAPAARGPEHRNRSPRRDLRRQLEDNRRGQGATTAGERTRQLRRDAAVQQTSATAQSPAPVMAAQHRGPGWVFQPPEALPAGGGCMALSPALRQVQWPPKFRPHIQ